MAKYTTPTPWIGLSEILFNYILTMNVVKHQKNHNHLKITSTYIAKQFMLAKVFFNKSLQILEDGASSVHVGILNM